MFTFGIVFLVVACAVHVYMASKAGRKFAFAMAAFYAIVIIEYSIHHFNMESNGYEMKWSTGNLRFIYTDKDGKVAP